MIFDGLQGYIEVNASWNLLFDRYKKDDLCKGTYASDRPCRHTYGNYRYTVANVDPSESE